MAKQLVHKLDFNQQIEGSNPQYYWHTISDKNIRTQPFTGHTLKIDNGRQLLSLGNLDIIIDQGLLLSRNKYLRSVFLVSFLERLHTIYSQLMNPHAITRICSTCWCVVLDVHILPRAYCHCMCIGRLCYVYVYSFIQRTRPRKHVLRRMDVC